MQRSMYLIIRTRVVKSVLAKFQTAPRVARCGIPKGFWLEAQGCEERATLGKCPTFSPTLKGLWHRSVIRERRSNRDTTLSGLNVLRRATPRVARSSQPWAGGHNPFGIVTACFA